MDKHPTKILLVFPHQLFADHPGLASSVPVWLVEHPLYFGTDAQYPCQMHQQKLCLHRASMEAYEKKLTRDGHQVRYVDHYEADFSSLFTALDQAGASEIIVADPVDYTLSERLENHCQGHGLTLTVLDTPNFLNTKADNEAFFTDEKKYFMKTFYQYQRTRLKILLDEDGKPTGGQWSYDADNRKKLPKKLVSQLPDLPNVAATEITSEAMAYVRNHFPDNPGSLDTLFYPTTHEAAVAWLDDFLEQRLAHFGPYEDAIVPDQTWLYHSVLTPMLNIGLLTPRQVIDTTLAYTRKHDIPIQSVEGFIRQIIGWREFIRATYETQGVQMRTHNVWQHRRKMPRCFYDGTSGIEPVDNAIKRLLRTGYLHHIERLMVLGGFFFLCEIDPDEIYRWFMELFVDSYDWVMVPNVYAMSQNSAGDLITTKPYFSGSNYIRKMSHYPPGDWCEVWDGLYWRFIDKHADALAANPRWSMMVSMVRKMEPAKLRQHKQIAEQFLQGLE